MQRYFAEMAFIGEKYSGWQRQTNAHTVQEAIEESLSTILQKNTPVVGCGRTDAGVHARQFYFHFDVDITIDPLMIMYKLNRMLDPDIGILRLFPVEDNQHARFDASLRRYEYKLIFKKDPFLHREAFLYNQKVDPNFDLMNVAAAYLPELQDYFTFSKTKTDVTNYQCMMTESFWRKQENDIWIYTVAANRFLRGMVRLIVGMCLNVATGRTSLDEVRRKVETGQPMDHAWSVPAHGLTLTHVHYPFISKVQ